MKKLKKNKLKLVFVGGPFNGDEIVTSHPLDRMVPYDKKNKRVAVYELDLPRRRYVYRP